MNKQKIYLNRKSTLDLFNQRTISGKQGFVKIWGNENGHCRDSHELTKFLVCKKLRFEYGFEIWTEVELKNNKGRLDILCIDKNGNGVIVEILETESEARFSAKEEIYPLPIMRIDTKNFDIDSWDF